MVERKQPTKSNINFMLKMYGVCAVCSERLNGYYEADHKKELWDGGTNDDENWQPLCKNCHRKKTSENATFRSEVNILNGKTGANKKRKEIKSSKETFNKNKISGGKSISNNNKIMQSSDIHNKKLKPTNQKFGSGFIKNKRGIANGSNNFNRNSEEE